MTVKGRLIMASIKKTTAPINLASNIRALMPTVR
jgi:hypothetical protein